jgi:hypothetical protein
MLCRQPLVQSTTDRGWQDPAPVVTTSGWPFKTPRGHTFPIPAAAAVIAAAVAAVTRAAQQYISGVWAEMPHNPNTPPHCTDTP